ncbi:MAG: hypothetical protein NTU41_11370, partial [Chloroflexi bacterium]|nr:hypothetical protein [Chloroflexota bacterium]
MVASSRDVRGLGHRCVLYAILIMALLASSVLGTVSPARAAATAATAQEKATAVSDDTTQLKTVSVRATPDADSDLVSENGKISLHIPKGAVSEDVDIRMTERGIWGPSDSGILNVLEFHAVKVNAGK